MNSAPQTTPVLPSSSPLPVMPPLASMPPLPSVSDGGDFLLVLQNELVARIRRNPRYSLRQYARQLGVDHSRLSKILRRQRPLSAAMIRDFGERLNLAPAAIAGYAEEHAARPRAPRRRTQAYQPIPLDLFELIEDWRHYAILELLKLKDFRADHAWVAGKLHVSEPEARAYMDRLQRVGLLEIRDDGTWLDRSEGFSTHVVSPEFTSFAHKRSQRRILRLAERALDEVDILGRDQSSMLMASSKERIANAKIMIKKFRHSLCEYLEAGEEKDTLLQLSVSLFPILEVSNGGEPDETL